MKIKVSTVAFSKNTFLVKELKKVFFDVEVNEKGMRISPNELAEFYKDANGIIVGLEKITPVLLDQLPELKIISKYGVGLDNIDLEACHERGITVGWSGGINKTSVAEMTIGFMLALCRNLYLTSTQLKNNFWNKDGGIQLTGRTIGIIGMGHIGNELVRLLKPYECKILANDIKALPKNNEYFISSKKRIISESDIVSVHTPLTDKTRGLFNREVFKKMKSSAYLINTARGEIVNIQDLKFALNEKIIAGAALDVYDSEPPTDLELLQIQQLICTPHIGGNANEAVIAMGMSAIQHLVEFER